MLNLSNAPLNMDLSKMDLCSYVFSAKSNMLVKDTYL